MADIHKGDAAFGMLEIVVFEVAGEVDVGFLVDGVVDEEIAGASADGHAAHDGGNDVAGAEQGEAEAEFDLLEKGVGGDRVGERANHSGTDMWQVFVVERVQDVTICQSEMERQDSVHTVLEVVEVGVGGIEGYVVTYQFNYQSAGGIGRGDTLHAAEY